MLPTYPRMKAAAFEWSVGSIWRWRIPSGCARAHLAACPHVMEDGFGGPAQIQKRQQINNLQRSAAASLLILHHTIASLLQYARSILQRHCVLCVPLFISPIVLDYFCLTHAPNPLPFRYSENRYSIYTTRKRSIGTSTLAPVKNEPALTYLNSVRRAR
jgi:hypothetical protein